eukprot:Gb_04397 [translate_table: standard]
MDCLFRGRSGDDDLSEGIIGQEVERCPFLRNISKPTNFSFSAPSKFPTPVKGVKGPIFEDGPNFDMAFRLFHGHDGVVPLSGRSSVWKHSEPNDRDNASSSQFHPLAASAATISLSAFGPGGPFSFDSLMGKWKGPKENKKRDSKEKRKSDSSQEGHFHQALGNEWLETGNCPIAKSYQAVSRVLPLVAKVLQPPPGMKFRCPPAVVAARAALARTALVKSLRPRPLPAKMFAIGLLGMAANVPLGVWREHTEKFSPSWFVAIHTAIPFVAMLRKAVNMPKTAMAFTIAASILGQVIGSRAERMRLKSEETIPNAVQWTPQDINADVQVATSLRAYVSEDKKNVMNSPQCRTELWDTLKSPRSSACSDSCTGICF